MSASISIPPSSDLRFVYQNISPEANSIYPRLLITFEFSHTIPTGQPQQIIAVSNIGAELRTWSRGGWFYVGRLMLKELYYPMPPGSRRTLNCYLDLDHYGLNQIEKLREGGDVSFQVEFSIVTEAPTKGSFTSSTPVIRIPKSDWVENILPHLKFKDAILLEIPKLINSEFVEVANHVNNAWKQYSMGEYDRVLTDSRKALEALIKKIRDKGFETEAIDDKGEKKKVSDWAKLLGNKELGDIIGTINQKIWGFVTPGSHVGKAINKEDADFALMTTYALINLAIRRLTSV